jgi:hypothetical protein
LVSVASLPAATSARAFDSATSTCAFSQAVVVAFGQETTKKETTTKKKSKKGSTKTEKTEKKTTDPTKS